MLPLMKTVLVPPEGSGKLRDVLVRKELFHWEAWEGDRQGCEGRLSLEWAPWKGSSSFPNLLPGAAHRGEVERARCVLSSSFTNQNNGQKTKH